MLVSYAQNFEDVMLWRAVGRVENGFYIDIGAQDPVVDSVSKAFYEHGWRGIHVEPTAHYAGLLRQDRPDELVIQAAVSDKHGTLRFFEVPGESISTGDEAIARRHEQQGFPVHEVIVPSITLDDIFEQVSVSEIHWLKIDVEGMERQVLAGWMNSQVLPWIVSVESTIPCSSEENWMQWEPLLLVKGYECVYFDGLNRFYVSKNHPELVPAFRTPPNVFDEFALEESASTPFCQLIKKRYNRLEVESQQQVKQAQEELYVARRETEQTKQALEQELRQMEKELSVLSTQLVTQSVFHTDRERELVDRIEKGCCDMQPLEHESGERERAFSSLVTQVKYEARHHSQLHLKEIVECERAASQALEVLRNEMAAQATLTEREHAERECELSERIDTLRCEMQHLEHEWVEQERLLQAELTKQREEFHRQASFHQKELAEREWAASQALEALRSETVSQATLVAQEYTARENVIKDELNTLLHSLARREREFGEKLFMAQQSVEREKAELLHSHAEHERALNKYFLQREDALRQEHNQHLQILQNKFSDSLAHHHQQHEQFKQTAAVFEEHLNKQLQAEKLAVIQLKQAVVSINGEIDKLRSSFFWWITAPLRKVSALFSLSEPLSYCGSTEPVVCASKQNTAESPTQTIESSDNHIQLESIPMPSITQPEKVFAAQNLDELLSCYGEQFVRCAYYSLLGREPDQEGELFYLGRLRRGDSKLQILSDICRSAEGRACKRRLPGLKVALMHLTLRTIPVVGWLFSMLSRDHHYNVMERTLRRVENQLCVMNDNFHKRFDQVEMTLNRLSAISIKENMEEKYFVTNEQCSERLKQVETMLAQLSTILPQVSVQQIPEPNSMSAEIEPHVLEVMLELQYALTAAKELGNENSN